MQLDNLVALVRDEIKNNKKTKSGIKSYRTIKDKSDLLRKNEPMAHNDPDMYDVKFVSGLTEGEEDNNKTLRSKIANHYNVSLSKLSTLKLDGTDSTIKLSRALNLPIDDTNFEGVKETIRKLSESENELTEGEENDYYIVGQLKNSFSQVFGEETFGDDTEEYDLMQSLDDETSEKLIDDLERQGITVAYDEADDSLTVVNHGKPNKEFGIEINEEDDKNFVSKYSNSPSLMTRRDKSINSIVQHNGVNISRKNLIEKYIDEGAVIKTHLVLDKIESKKLTDEYEYLKRNAPIGNKKHPQTIRLKELTELAKSNPYDDGIRVKIEQPVLEKVDGSFFKLTQFEEDYAKQYDSNKNINESVNEELINDELQEGFDDDDFEQYVKNHLLDIDDNMNRYGYNLSDLSKMYNYYDLAHLLDADTRIMKDVDVSYWSNFLRQLMEEYLPHHMEENEEELNESTSEKEPWQMTRDEFYDFYGGDSNFGNLITAHGANKPDIDDFTESEYRRFKEAKRLAKVKATDVLPLLDKAKNKNRIIYHYTIIKNALSEGKPIPPEVLKDYPELQKEDFDLTKFRITNVKQLRDNLKR
jgi:hypothetical protein